MKLILICYTIIIIVISVDCGLVKEFFGNVKEDIHTVVEGTVSVIGKGTHKISEGLGVFLHRNEGTKFPNWNSGKKDAHALATQISNDEMTDNADNYDGGDNKHKENASAYKDHGQDHNHVQFTPVPATVEHSNNDPTTTSNYNKNVKEHEATNNNEYVFSTTAANTGTTTETPWLNGAELESILPTITHNETHFTGNTNELGIGDNQKNNQDFDEANKKAAKCDDDVKPAESNKANLVSDQMFFKDNKPKQNDTNSFYVCAEGLVRAANGDCLKQIEIDVRKKVEPLVANVFQADGCVSGYARALDGSCQKVIG